MESKFFILWHSVPITISFFKDKITRVVLSPFIGHISPTPLNKIFTNFLSGKLPRKEMYKHLDFSNCSNFQKKVYKSMKTLNKPITYKQLAEKNNTHPRAVAMAMKHNPFPLVIPCHLIVAVNGLGGFSSPQGVELKKKLIELEPIY